MGIIIRPTVPHLRSSYFLFSQNLAGNVSLPRTRDVTVAAKRYASQSPFNEDENRRIYILGTSPVAMLATHGLASSPEPPPITLLATNSKMLDHFEEQDWAVEVIRDGISSKVHGVEMETIVYQSRSALLSPRLKVLQIQPTGWLANYDRIEVEKEHAKPTPPAPGVTLERKTEPNKKSAPSDSQWPGMYLSKIMAPVKEQFKLVRKQQLQELSRKIEGLGTDPKPGLPLIKYLFITSHPQYLERTMLDLKPRLRKESTIVFMAKGLGFLEKLDKVVWPDISTRPSYIMGISNHVAWIPGPDGKPSKKSLDDALNFRDSTSIKCHFVAAVTSTGSSALFLGPIEQDCYIGSFRETPEDLEQRNLNAKYFLDHLCLAKGLNVQRLDQSKSLWKRFVRLAGQSVVAPLCTIYQLPLHCLFNGPGSEKRKQEALALMEQVYRVLRKTQPQITFETIEKAVIEACRIKEIDENTGEPQENYSTMLLDVLLGRMSELDFLNGWTVREGKKSGIDVSMHENVISQILAKTEERISLKIKLEQAKTLAQREEHTGEWAKRREDMMKVRQEAWEAKREKRAEKEWYGMTRAEKREWKKLEGIRKRIDTLRSESTPKIKPLGNVTIVRYAYNGDTWNPLNGPRPKPTSQPRGKSIPKPKRRLPRKS